MAKSVDLTHTVNFLDDVQNECKPLKLEVYEAVRPINFPIMSSNKGLDATLVFIQLLKIIFKVMSINTYFKTNKIAIKKRFYTTSQKFGKMF